METQLEDRQRFTISIFSDEYKKLGLEEHWTLRQAQDAIREKLDLPHRQRYSPKGTIRNLLKDADDEQLKEILEILQDEE